jgi:hypothetical protein
MTEPCSTVTTRPRLRNKLERHYSRTLVSLLKNTGIVPLQPAVAPLQLLHGLP